MPGHLLNRFMSFLQNITQSESIAALQFHPNLGFIDPMQHGLSAIAPKNLAIVSYYFNCSCCFASINHN